jgi:hypothetical protein
MSIKRSHVGRGTTQSDTSAQKVDRQELFDELRKRAPENEPFMPVDVGLSIGASEAAVAKALLILSAAGYIEKLDGGRFRTGQMAELDQAEFNRTLSASGAKDSQRQQAATEIQRLKQNNDIMRERLVKAQAERDRYLALLQKHNIDPNQPV